MITSLPYNLLICAVVSSLFTALDHQKSFLLVDSAAIVQSIAIYKNSLLLTSSNDIVQKDIETGSILRTFRGHTNQIWSFVITENDRMITSAFDDMIIVWDLLTASILDRIWLRAQMTLVTSLVHQNNFAYAGGNDKSVRQIDLVSGRITKTIGKL
jgi:WD40 repeat protein